MLASVRENIELLGSFLPFQVIEDETRELVRNWTSPKYAKNVKKFLKDNHYTFISIRRTNMQNAL